jgi:ADP-heptose:LPS heptosyltransferase
MKSSSHRILLTGDIADAILFTPVIREWRRRNRSQKLTIYCFAADVADIFYNNPGVQRTILFGEFRRRFFSHPKLGALFQRLYPAIGYMQSVPTGLVREHAVNIFAEMLNIKLNDLAPELFVSSSENVWARGKLEGIRAPVSIQPYSSACANKEWDGGQWEALIAERTECTFLQFGSRTRDLLRGAKDFRGYKTRENIALIANCMAHVGIDGEFAHIAVAVEKPAFVLFGPSTPEVWGHSGAQIFYSPTRCSPCIDTLGDGRCPYDRECMRSISLNALSGAIGAWSKQAQS